MQIMFTSCKCDAQEEKCGQFRTMHSKHGVHLTRCFDYDKRQQGADLTLKFTEACGVSAEYHFV